MINRESKFLLIMTDHTATKASSITKTLSPISEYFLKYRNIISNFIQSFLESELTIGRRHAKKLINGQEVINITIIPMVH